MSLTLVLIAILLLVGGALACAVLARSDQAALVAGGLSSLAACAAGFMGSILGLAHPGEVTSRLVPWGQPIGQLHVRMDSLSAFFLLCLFLVGGLATIYSLGALQSWRGKRSLAPVLAFSNLLLAATAGVAIAYDGVLFLFTWELMSLATFLLITVEHDREESRRAGITYLIASHASLVLLFLLFGLLANEAGSFDFARITAAAPGATLPAFAFLLAAGGFGTKAGLWPVHVWVPDAYSAAPSHVVSVMSVKIGIFGLLRMIGLLGELPTWCGAVLIALGVISGVTGALHALAQRDIKRLLAYSSVENAGIMCLGLGLGMLGTTHHLPALAALGFGAALLHLFNHGLFKAMLFQAAGSVVEGTGVRNIDRLGGLLKRVPVIGTTFLVGAVAASGLPPLNGFVGEWLILVGSLKGAGGLPSFPAALAVTALASMALIGGLAAACFLRAYGIAFLGAPRETLSPPPPDASPTVQGALVLGSALCLLAGLFPMATLTLAAAPVHFLAGEGAAAHLEATSTLSITRLALALLVVFGALALLRRWLLRGREIRTAPTWGCGYAAPGPRMQYTATSFSDPILEPFASLLPKHVRSEGPEGFFPERARHEEHLGDLAGERILVPVARRVVYFLGRVRILQHGKLHLYLTYVLVTLIALLVWQLIG